MSGFTHRLYLLFFSLTLFAVPFCRFLWDDWAILTLFGISLLLFCLYLLNKLANLIFPQISWPLTLFCFTAFLILSSAHAANSTPARIHLMGYAAITLFYLFSSGNSQKTTDHLQLIFCASASIYAVFYILTLLKNDISNARLTLEFFINHNLAASFMLFSLFAAWNQLARHKWQSLAAIGLSIIALMMSKSIAALLGLIMAIIYLRKTRAQNSRQHIAVWILTACAVCGIGILMRTFIIQSFSDRARWWMAAIKLIKISPIFGNGPGSYEIAGQEYMAPGLKSVFAHSYPLQMAAELGLPTLFFWVIFLYSEWKQGKNRYLKAGLLAVFTQNLTDISMNLFGILLFFILFLAWSKIDEETGSMENAPS